MAKIASIWRYILKPIMIANALIIPASLSASTSSNGHVTEIVSNPTSSGSFSFSSDGTRTTLPSCGSANPTRWVFDVSTANGQATAATVITAFAQGRMIYVQGTGTCPANQSDIESVSFLAIS